MIRLDLLRVILLVMVCTLIWCTAYNRWSYTSWETPIDYHGGSDCLIMMAWIKAAGDGHLMPFQFSFVPELGAPCVGNWNDFPVTEKLLFCITGGLGRLVGLFFAANLAVCAGQVFAAVAFYVSCRLLHASWLWAFTGAVLFGMSRFAFAHELNHINVLYYWYVPLGLVVVEWLATGEGIQIKEWRFVFALLVAFVTGAGHVYYTNLFAQLVLLAGLIQGLRYGWRQGWFKALPAVLIAGTALATGVLMNLNTIVYQFIHGYNSGAIDRQYLWLEIFGLKFIDLVVPPPDHRLPFFAHWGLNHLGEVYLSWGEMPPTGYIGLVGLAALAWLAVTSFRRVMNNAAPPFELWLILWIFLYGAVGGIDGIIGSLGSYLFRATTRYSIYVLCIVLMFAVRRMTPVNFRYAILSYASALLILGLALWDTIPPIVSSASITATAQDVEWDRAFTGEIEKRLPPNSMVFQLPMVDYPEGAYIPMSGPYDGFRPYFFAHHLRFSFGSDKGNRPEVNWQESLLHLTPDEVIDKLESYGFAALTINRFYYDDHGDAFARALKARGYNERIENGRGDLFCVLLKPSPKPVMLYYPSAEWPSKFSDSTQAKIVLHQWNSREAEGYVAMQKANPNVPSDGLTLWLKADSGVTGDRYGHVSKWTDQNGDFTLTQSGSNMPTYAVNAINGRPALQFDGSQWLKSPANIRLQNGLSMIAVTSTPSPDSQEYSIYLGSGSGAMLQNRGIGYLSGQELFDTSGGYVLGGVAPPPNTFTVEAVTLDDTLTNVTFYQNGIKIGAATIKDVKNPSPGITVGATADPSCRWLGDIAEILVYDHKLSDAEMSRVQAYLAHKYGMDSSSPTLSPFGGPLQGSKSGPVSKS